MTQQLSMLVFVEDTGLIPRTRVRLTAFHNSSCRALMPHSDLDTDQTDMQYKDIMCKQNIHTHKIKIFKKWYKNKCNYTKYNLLINKHTFPPLLICENKTKQLQFILSEICNTYFTLNHLNSFLHNR